MTKSAQIRTAAIVLAYRNLYRSGLRAIQYAQPARHTLRRRLSLAFRSGRPDDFDAARIRNTLKFLRLASLVPSLEHRILKSLLQTWLHDPSVHPRHLSDRQIYLKIPESEINIHATAREQYQQTVRMLNETMGMCIPP